MNPTLRRILVLDDDPVMRDLLEALLSLEGHDVQLAASGEEALQLLQRDGNLDLVLTDVQMPGLSGAALAHGLREAMPGTALLLGMSGSEVPLEAQSVYDAFLSKPFDMQLLGDTIERVQQAADRLERVSDRADTHTTASPTEGLAPIQTEVLAPDIFGSLAKLIPSAKLQELFELTMDDIQKRHRRMTAAAASGDLVALQRDAHAVKGSCGMVGAAELQDLASAIEGGTSVNTAALAEMPAALGRLRRMLESKFKNS